MYVEGPLCCTICVRCAICEGDDSFSGQDGYVDDFHKWCPSQHIDIQMLYYWSAELECVVLRARDMVVSPTIVSGDDPSAW